MPSEKWKDGLNKTMLLFARTLEPEEWEVWRKFLELLPPHTVELAFENWQRNGRFFPKPKDILDLVTTYREADQQKFRSCGQCDSDGWVSEINAKNERIVRRCECWKTWAAKQNAA